MKAFFRGLGMGFIGCMFVLVLAAGVCYFGGLLDFAGNRPETAAAFAGLVTEEMLADLAVETEEEPKPETAEKELPIPEPAVEADSIRLLFAGDLYLMEYAQSKYQNSGISALASEEVLALTKNADLFILNQEFPFGTTGEAMEDKEYTFRVPPDLVSIPAELGVDLVTLANNHILDFGRDPLTETITALDGAGIAHVGAGADLEEARALKTFEVQGKTLGFLGASRVIPVASWNASKYASGVFTTYDPALLVAEIQKAKETCDFVAVLVHWGIERNTFPEDYQKELAYQYIDAGADAVIGSHPHVLQGIEFYQGKPIFYSLGNFIFNNSVYESIMVELELTGDEIWVRAVPCISEGNQMRLLGGNPDYYQRLQELSFGVRVEADGRVVEK